MIENIRSIFSFLGQEENGKFGTFDGVFMPTLLTIMGAVMYLRTGWVVGNAGLLGGIAVILLANFITILTGLSISSVATNIRVRAGGAFSIISQSLGLEVGGSVSVPFYLAQAISVAFYIFAFSEGWQRIFPSHPTWLVVFVGYGLCFAIAYVSVNLAVRVRYPILFIILLSLFSIFLGSFERFGGGFTQTPQMWGTFADVSFWGVFAVFFPAVTGILTGVNMSGTLKNPRRSIPIGVMAGIFITMIVYLALAYWVSRVATPTELITNVTIMVDRAAFGWAVMAGILAATFSAALNSLVSAPRVLQAIAEHDIVPGGQIFARETDTGEPRPAMFLTGAIGIATLIFGLSGGGLNTIAPLMTMFFLIVYAVLNGVVLMEQMIGLVSFRPLFRVPVWVPLVGLAGCLGSMFLIAPLFSLVAVIVIVLLYITLSRRQLRAPWSDVRSGLFVTVAEWAAKRVFSMPDSQERAWRPSLLVPVDSPQPLRGSYRFLKAFTYPRGSVHILGMYQDGQKQQVQELESFENTFANDGIFSRVALVSAPDFVSGLRTGMEVLRMAFFRPNILFLPIRPDTNESALQQVLRYTKDNKMGVILYAKHPEISLGYEKVINVWIRDQSPEWEVGLRLSNLDLALLLAYKLARNWQGRINLITIVSDPNEVANGEKFLADLTDIGRMPRTTQTFVRAGTFTEWLPQMPQADLNIFGLQQKINLQFVNNMVTATDSSCIFVRDSGEESALA
ncbi:MAG: Na-K-Cl cotransporter [Chloroflexi bacterium]|nr:MAG: Na-K-Cl cotransporter [Chloroflexota bacterium]